MKRKTETGRAAAPRGGDGARALAPVPAKARGRPLSFDREAALDKAMHVFWEHGYEAASIADLTAAMGITPPSLYTAFGDKAHLFLEAIEAYGKGPGGFGARARRRADRSAWRATPARGSRRRADPGLPPARLHDGDGHHQLLGRRRARAGGARQAPRRRRREHAGADPARHRRGRAAGARRCRCARQLLCDGLPGHVDAGQGRCLEASLAGQRGPGDALVARRTA